MSARRKRSKRKSRGAVFKIIAAFILISTIIYYIVSFIFRPDFVKYAGFGINMPAKYGVHGIDVSRYQKKINWPQVKAMNDNGISLQFVYIKATEGVLNVDPFFRRNWVNARESGIARGAYHFFTPNRDGKKQAINFIETVNLLPGDLPPVLDVEKTYGKPAGVIQKEVAAWLLAVEEAYHVQPIIYTNVAFYNTYLSGYFEGYPLWVAHYFAEGKPRIQRDWLMWQHSERGRVDGISSPVDFNAFSGSSRDFENLKIK